MQSQSVEINVEREGEKKTGTKDKDKFDKWKSVQIEMDIVAPNNGHPF